MRVTTASELRLQLNLMSMQLERIQQLQIEASTGKRLLRPSEDPVAAQTSQFVSDNIQTLETYQSNIAMTQSRTNLFETTLKDSMATLIEAQRLMLAAQNDTHADSDRSNIATTMNDLLQHLLGLVSTRDENGEYIFSGMNVTLAPYTGSASAGYVYQGTQNPIEVSISESMTAVYNEPGILIFGQVDTGTDLISVFDVLNDTVTLLNTPITSTTQREAYHTQLNTEMQLLSQSMDNMLIYISNLGTQGQTLLQQQATNEQELINQKIYLGSLIDADMPAVISELTQRLTNLEVMQQSYVKVQDTLKRILV